MSSHALTDNPWLPRASCDSSCIRPDTSHTSRPAVVALRTSARIVCALMLFPALPLLAVPLPGKSKIQRIYCRMMLRCIGVRITVSGGPIRNLSGVLVVSGHVSWVDIFTIGAVLPGSFVARADLVDWPALGFLARLLKVIPIERANLRGLPDVVPPWPTGCGPDRPSSHSRRAPPGVDWATARSGPPCSRAPSTRPGRCSRCA
jgi:1-acyl-sn-glycerol-3-phosphate acyltransferase